MLHYTFIHCKIVYRVCFCCRLTDLMKFLKPVHVGRKSGSISLFIASSFVPFYFLICQMTMLKYSLADCIEVLDLIISSVHRYLTAERQLAIQELFVRCNISHCFGKTAQSRFRWW